MFKKVTLAGVGLLGGSLGLNLKIRALAREVVGYVRRAGSVEECNRVGVVTRATLSVEEAFTDAELVVFCVPVSQIPVLARTALPFLKAGTVVTDVGSTKREVVEELEAIFRPAGIHFVGSHPMAGSEKTGPINAYADLFRNTICLLTPTEATDPEALERVQELWRKVGCETVLLSPSAHDELVCRASHLPHLIATALVEHVLGKNSAGVQAKICASGFRDTTRVASGSPDMWRDIVLTNRKQLLSEIDAYIETLEKMKETLKTESPENIRSLFSDARKLRNRWLDSR